MSHNVSGPESVFLSYTRRDRLHVDKIIRTLKAQGLLNEQASIVAPPDSSIPGTSVRNALRSAIESASKVVLVWSDDSANSQYVNYEAGMAEALGKPIILAVLGRKSLPLPTDLRTAQVVKISE